MLQAHLRFPAILAPASLGFGIFGFQILPALFKGGLLARLGLVDTL